MPDRITFDTLVARYGEVLAWHCLAEIERAARLRPQSSIDDPEERIAIALCAQDSMREPALLSAA